VSTGPWRRIAGEREVRDSDGVRMKIVTLECGHEQIGGPPYNERQCPECEDKAKYGQDKAKYGPAPRPPMES
jgi:hypothetical protein